MVEIYTAIRKGESDYEVSIIFDHVIDSKYLSTEWKRIVARYMSLIWYDTKKLVSRISTHTDEIDSVYYLYQFDLFVV